MNSYFIFLQTVKILIEEHNHAVNAAGVAAEKTHKQGCQLKLITVHQNSEEDKINSARF